MLKESKYHSGLFTSDHFELLSKWAGHKRHESNLEQNQAYDVT